MAIMDIMDIMIESVAEDFIKFCENVMVFQDIHMSYKKSRSSFSILQRTETINYKDVAVRRIEDNTVSFEFRSTKDGIQLDLVWSMFNKN